MGGAGNEDGDGDGDGDGEGGAGDGGGEGDGGTGVRGTGSAVAIDCESATCLPLSQPATAAAAISTVPHNELLTALWLSKPASAFPLMRSTPLRLRVICRCSANLAARTNLNRKVASAQSHSELRNLLFQQPRYPELVFVGPEALRPRLTAGLP